MHHEHLESPQNMDGTVKSTAPKIGRSQMIIIFAKIIVIFINYCTFPVVVRKTDELDGTSNNL